MARNLDLASPDRRTAVRGRASATRRVLATVALAGIAALATPGARAQSTDSWVGAGQWPLQLGPEDEVLAKGRRGGVHYAVYTARTAQDQSAAAVPANAQLTPAEREAFAKATRPVYDKWKATIGPDLVKTAEAAIAARKK